MKRVNRRKFMMLASVGATGAALSACGNDLDVEVNPTQIPDVPGAPPTLAPPAGSPPAESSPAASGGEGAAPGGAGAPVMLEAQDPYNWSTNTLEAAPGQVIQITNTGLGQHDFVVDEWGVDADLPNGEPVEVTVPEDATPGDTFVYYCSVPGHRENGMEGDLTIVEAAAPPAAAAPEEEAPAASGGEAPAAGAGEPVVLEALDPFDWSTYALEVAPGQVIQITNVGLQQHDFVVDELELHTDLPNGEPVEVTVPEDATPGDTFVFYCSIPGHRESGMEGDLTIVEAAASAASAGGSAEATPPPSGEEATPPPAETAPSSPAAVTSQGPEASPAVQATPRAGTIVVEVQDSFTWNPSSLTVAPGDVISVTNAGVLEHSFAVDEWSIDRLIPNGGLIEVQVPEDVQFGDTFTFYCSTTGHRDRGEEGTITVQ